MHEWLRGVSEIVNLSFDILDLLVVRVALLGLAAIGAYTLLLKRSA
jgi:hypothetical protein